MVTTHSKSVLNGPMDDKKVLSLFNRSEASPLALLLSRRLMKSLNAVVLVLTGAAVDKAELWPVGKRVRMFAEGPVLCVIFTVHWLLTMPNPITSS